MNLAFDSISGAQASRTIAFLHGILGRRSNLQTLAKQFLAQHPSYTACLVDLRGHGKSPKGTAGATLEAAARDVRDLAATLPMPLAAIVGHSFGGKVALEAAHPGGISSLRHVMTIDSMPGAREPSRGGDSALGILETIESLPETFASITEFTLALEETGLARPIAQWLASSLERNGDRLRFGLDLNEMRSLILDYYTRDLWGVVEQTPEPIAIHLVIANRSESYSAEERARAAQITARHPRVTVEVIEAGHWVHVDNLEHLLKAMNRLD